MAARPTTIQEIAIRTAMNNNRLGDATQYTGRTLDTMQRNGWTTFPNNYTYRLTPNAAIAVGKYAVADEYQREDLLATDPKAQRQAAVVALAREVGVTAFSGPGITETVSISVEDLARLLAAARPMAYAT